MCSPCLQFSEGAEEEGAFSEFDEGTRNMQLLWTSIQPSSHWIKSFHSYSLMFHHLCQLIHFLVLYHCTFVC